MIRDEGHAVADDRRVAWITGDDRVGVRVGGPELQARDQLLPQRQLDAARASAARVDVDPVVAGRIAAEVGLAVDQVLDVVLVVRRVHARPGGEALADAHLPAVHRLGLERRIRREDGAAA
ncbi:hypothetical protein D3C83_22940 [compost metagenome]